MTTILSIDPAIKNLGIVKMQFKLGVKVSDLDINLIDLCNGKKVKEVKFIDIIENLLDNLNKIDITDVDVVLIENIPSMKNPSVKSISVAIFTYYAMKNKEVHFVSPSRKLTKEENKLTYKERKKASIKKVIESLNEEEVKQINKYKKIDDICDCISQAKAYLLHVAK